MSNRWLIYQRERFPLAAHGPLVAAFSFSAVSYSALLRGHAATVRGGSIIVAFFTALIFFLQLRIADEFKDFEEDARYRPYRPVPRGLVTLRELAIVGMVGALLQFGLALWLHASLTLLLALVWLYLSLMTREFFVRDWLKAHPFTYLWTHMMILPLIDLYATSCDWMVADGSPPRGLFWFLIVSYFNGMVIEIGRKIRAPEDEEEGVQTYSVVWGRRGAVGAWLGAMALTAIAAFFAARRIGFIVPVTTVLAALLCIASLVTIRFLRQPVTRRARLIEPLSGLWTLLLYLTLGAVPLLLRLL